MRAIRNDDCGESLVEFSVSAVVLLTLFFGIMDCARALYVYHFVSYAAQQATRYSIVRGSRWSGTSCSSTTTQECEATDVDVQNYVRSIVPPGVTASGVSATTRWLGTTVTGTGCSNAKSQGCLVRVTVSCSYNFLLPFIPQSAVTFSGTSEQPIQE